MRASIEVEGFKAITHETKAEIDRRAKTGVEVSGEGLKRELRTMTQAALGPRVAKTWQLNFYGMRGGESPAAYLYSKAPNILKGHIEGSTIVPVHGSRYIAIPTDRVPRRRGRGAKARMSPFEVEVHFNQDLISRPGRNGSILLFVEVIRARSKRRPGYRQPTPGRKAQGRKVELVHMFTLRRAVRLPKRISAEQAFTKWGRRLGRFLETGA